MANRNASVIIQDPEILGGEPVFRGTRAPFRICSITWRVATLSDDFLEQFPGVKREDAIAALEEAKAVVLAHVGR